jgi:RNA polymerase sigma-70 factor (ECF subfamily)
LTVRESGSDADLVPRLKRRDKDSLLELYELYSRTVYRYLMHMTGSISAAEELTQEVFVVILDGMMAQESLRSFDPGRGTLEGYLLGIARNLARSEQSRCRRLVSLDEVSENMDWSRLFGGISHAAGSWDNAEALVTQTELKLLQGYILDLPEHYRSVVVLCALQEKSYRDVAGILGCSEGTVASRFNRAKVLLAAKLSGGSRMGSPKPATKGGAYVRASATNR